jgi:hypothetical protein
MNRDASVRSDIRRERIQPDDEVRERLRLKIVVVGNAEIDDPQLAPRARADDIPGRPTLLT